MRKWTTCWADLEREPGGEQFRAKELSKGTVFERTETDRVVDAIRNVEGAQPDMFSNWNSHCG